MVRASLELNLHLAPWLTKLLNRTLHRGQQQEAEAAWKGAALCYRVTSGRPHRPSDLFYDRLPRGDVHFDSNWCYTRRYL